MPRPSFEYVGQHAATVAFDAALPAWCDYMPHFVPTRTLDDALKEHASLAEAGTRLLRRAAQTPAASASWTVQTSENVARQFAGARTAALGGVVVRVDAALVARLGEALLAEKAEKDRQREREKEEREKEEKERRRDEEEHRKGRAAQARMPANTSGCTECEKRDISCVRRASGSCEFCVSRKKRCVPLPEKRPAKKVANKGAEKQKNIKPVSKPDKSSASKQTAQKPRPDTGETVPAKTPGTKRKRGESPPTRPPKKSHASSSNSKKDDTSRSSSVNTSSTDSTIVFLRTAVGEVEGRTLPVTQKLNPPETTARPGPTKQNATSSTAHPQVKPVVLLSSVPRPRSTQDKAAPVLKLQKPGASRLTQLPTVTISAPLAPPQASPSESGLNHPPTVAEPSESASPVADFEHLERDLQATDRMIVQLEDTLADLRATRATKVQEIERVRSSAGVGSEGVGVQDGSFTHGRNGSGTARGSIASLPAATGEKETCKEALLRAWTKGTRM